MGKQRAVSELEQRMCDRCGVWVTARRLVGGRHTCERDVLLDFQSRLARIVIDVELEDAVAEWATEPRIASQVAFARYLRERAAV